MGWLVSILSVTNFFLFNYILIDNIETILINILIPVINYVYKIKNYPKRLKLIIEDDDIFDNQLLYRKAEILNKKAEILNRETQLINKDKTVKRKFAKANIFDNLYFSNENYLENLIITQNKNNKNIMDSDSSDTQNEINDSDTQNEINDSDTQNEIDDSDTDSSDTQNEIDDSDTDSSDTHNSMPYLIPVCEESVHIENIDKIF